MSDRSAIIEASETFAKLAVDIQNGPMNRPSIEIINTTSTGIIRGDTDISSIQDQVNQVRK